MNKYISTVLIRSLFSKDRTLKLELGEWVNCIHGVNGSGKTTVINTIVACLSCDIRTLLRLPFESVEIFLSDERKRTKNVFMSVKKADDNRVIVSIPGEDIEDVFDPDEIESTAYYLKRHRALTDLIKKYISLTYVPLTRLQEADIYDLERIDDMYLQRSLRARHLNEQETAYVLDPNRRMLVTLEAEFREKYSEVQNSIKKLLEDLRNKIFSKMLIDKQTIAELKTTTPLEYLEADITKLADHQTPEDLNKKLTAANIKISQSDLTNHFRLYEKEVKNLQKLRESIAKSEEITESMHNSYSQSFYLVLSLSALYNKIFSIMDVVEGTERQKEELLILFKETADSINDFLINKSFEFKQNGEFRVTCGDKELDIAELSSGEKHIIALLGRVALSRSEGTIFVADEPELSLHLEWQRKILQSINKLSPNMQIIVATHSPAIIPSDAKMIDLEECMS